MRLRYLLYVLGSVALLTGACFTVLPAGAWKWLACENDGSEACGRKPLADAQFVVACIGIAPADPPRPRHGAPQSASTPVARHRNRHLPRLGRAPRRRDPRLGRPQAHSVGDQVGSVDLKCERGQTPLPANPSLTASRYIRPRSQAKTFAGRRVLRWHPALTLSLRSRVPRGRERPIRGGTRGEMSHLRQCGPNFSARPDSQGSNGIVP
jgi:hypothetical protein